MTEKIKQLLLSENENNIDIALYLFFIQEKGTIEQLQNFLYPSDIFKFYDLQQRCDFRNKRNFTRWYLDACCMPFISDKLKKEYLRYKTKGGCFGVFDIIKEGLIKYLKIEL